MNNRFAAIVVVLGLPWTIIVVNGAVELVFVWGLVNPDPVHVVWITDYVFKYTRGLPERLLAWPISSVLGAASLVSAAAGAGWDREDRRVTAGLLVLAGLTHLGFTLGVGRRNPLATVVPIGPVVAWVVVWWFDWRVGWATVGGREQ